MPVVRPPWQREYIGEWPPSTDGQGFNQHGLPGEHDWKRKKAVVALYDAANEAVGAMAAISPHHIPSTKDWEALRDAQRAVMKAMEGLRLSIDELRKLPDRSERLRRVMDDGSVPMPATVKQDKARMMK